jgi:hypothetical protein
MDSSKLRRIEDCKGRLKELVGNEGVLQLARDGICPHYIVINPITGEENIRFIASELNEWFDANYVNYREGAFVQKYTFLCFDKAFHNESQQMPDELSHVSQLYRLPIEHISTPPGIYFLCKQKKIRYIGQTVNVASRIITHMSEGLKDFDSVFFITCPRNSLSDLEISLIKYLKPELNKVYKKSKTPDEFIPAKLILKHV